MSRELAIQIETPERGLDIEMLETGHVSKGTELALANVSTVTWAGVPLEKYAADPYVFSLLAGLVSGVGVNLLSNWLYDKLRGRVDVLRINRTGVESDRYRSSRAPRCHRNHMHAHSSRFCGISSRVAVSA